VVLVGKRNELLCTEYVKQAVELDKEEQYDQAFEYYMKGLEQFSFHCKYDKNPASKEAIRKRMEEYMRRAEYLKSVINSNTRTDGASGESSTAVGQKKKPAVCFSVPVCNKNVMHSLLLMQRNLQNSNEDTERAKMRTQLSSAIVTEKPNVHWEDVSGLEHAKDALKEAVILPVKFPQVLHSCTSLTPCSCPNCKCKFCC
jgi:vacuolar protein-sorting-associated protein 4